MGSVVRDTSQSAGEMASAPVPSGARGLWVSVEFYHPCWGVKVGGLGEVSFTIPWALNRYLSQAVRVVIPMMAPMRQAIGQAGGFFPLLRNGQPLTLQVPNLMGKTEPFGLYHAQVTGVDPEGAETPVVVYALANDRFFNPRGVCHDPAQDPNGKASALYFNESEPVGALGRDAIFKSLMAFNRAVVGAIPLLAQEMGGLDFVIANDWLTAPVLHELKALPGEHRPYRFFMLHNTYNNRRFIRTFDPGRVTRNNLAKWYLASSQSLGLSEPSDTKRNRVYSPLRLGFEAADCVIANRNYLDDVLRDHVDADYLGALKTQRDRGAVMDMHHGLDPARDPRKANGLKAQGGSAGILPVAFEPLRDAPALVLGAADIRRFKQVNKWALQVQRGLCPDPQAVILTWNQRFEPNQKGFFLTLKPLYWLMQDHPELQLVMTGGLPSDQEPYAPLVKAWIARMNAAYNPPPADNRGNRVWIHDGFSGNDAVVQMQAGSDIALHPSLYEPYGLVPIEAMWMGAIPLGTPVGGIRSTIYDPLVTRTHLRAFYERAGLAPEPIWEGETLTGFLLAPQDWAAYGRVFRRQYALSVDALLQEPMNVYEQAFYDTLRGALAFVKSEAVHQSRLCGMRYVEANHQWHQIAERYCVPIFERLPLCSGQLMGGSGQ